MQIVFFIFIQISLKFVKLKRQFNNIGSENGLAPGRRQTIAWTSTETKMSSFWWNFHHWLHWKLSKWQLPVQPVIKISSKWRHFRFSEWWLSLLTHKCVIRSDDLTLFSFKWITYYPRVIIVIYECSTNIACVLSSIDITMMYFYIINSNIFN